MKRLMTLLSACVLAAPLFAQKAPASHNAPVDPGQSAANRHFPPNPAGDNTITPMPDEDYADLAAVAKLHTGSESIHLTPIADATNLSYHGGDVINTARLVCIFWGPTWNNSASADYNRARTIESFRNQFGTTSHYAIITQYYDSAYINTTNLAGSQPDWFDTTDALPSNGNVTDSIVRQEVQRYINKYGVNYSTVYEVFLPKYVPGTSTLVYSSDGTSTSCGGPNLAYCAYHSSWYNGSGYVKYSIEPYPSCSGCQWSGWTVVENMEHFVTHETREAVTDPNGNAWYDSSGNEADDKCAWTGLFLENGYGYQPEWSNKVSGCVQ